MLLFKPYKLGYEANKSTMFHFSILIFAERKGLLYPLFAGIVDVKYMRDLMWFVKRRYVNKMVSKCIHFYCSHFCVKIFFTFVCLCAIFFVPLHSIYKNGL